MCELLAISADRPVGAGLSMRAFRHRGERNPHGWGFAYGEPGALQTRRFLDRLDTQPPGAASGVRTRVFLGHVRYKVAGAISMENTQPFVSKDGNWAFAGTMSACNVNERYAASTRGERAGRTGPETLFVLLQRALRRDANPGLAVASVVDEVFARTELEASARASFALTDGSSIYAYRHRTPLLSVTRRPPHLGEVALTDPRHRGYVARLEVEKGSDETATLLATTALTDETWQPIPDRIVVHVRDGVLVSPQARR